MEQSKEVLRTDVRLRLIRDKVFFGPGVMMILESLAANGSMKEACQQTGISYSKAWKMLNAMEEQLGYPVVERQHGGKSGGGCVISASGMAFMDAYREMEQRVKAYSEVVFHEVMDDGQLLRDVLSISRGEVVTLTGAGGKTTMLYELGKELMHDRVLLTTTTKMMYPGEAEVDRRYDEHDIRKQCTPIKSGRTFVYGTRLKNGKCSAISEEILESLVPQYDFTIVEADGSRGLPLKGYLSSEPCIPKCATLNVAIVTVAGIGKVPAGEYVLRPREFCEMTGMADDQLIGCGQMAKWISHLEGMFKGGGGRKILLFNQIEDEQQFALAKEIAGHLERSFLQTLDKIVVGSMKRREWRQL